MNERAPTLRDVLGAVSELRGEMGADVRGRLGRLGGEVTELRGEVVEQGRRLYTLTSEVAEQGHRQDRVDDRLNSLTREVETLRTDLPAQVVAGVLVGFERSAYATDLVHAAGGGSRTESRRGRAEASFGRVARAVGGATVAGDLPAFGGGRMRESRPIRRLTREQRDELDNLVKLAGGEVSRSRVARVRRRLNSADA